MSTETCAECHEPILNGQAAITSWEGGPPWIARHLDCWTAMPLPVAPEFVVAGEPHEIGVARERYVWGSLGSIDYWEQCGCATCHLELLDIDAKSIALDLMVAEMHRGAGAVS